MKKVLFKLLLLGPLFINACSSPTAADRLQGDAETAREAIQGYVHRGEEALPELRGFLEHSDPLVRRRARTAMGMITGMWGGDGRLVWKRSVNEARNLDKPLLVLHLFGKFDEEFC